MPSSIFPSITVFSNESVLPIRWLKYWSFSFSLSPSNEYSELIFFRIYWLEHLAGQGTLKSLLQHHSSKASILWCSAFFIVQLTSWSGPITSWQIDGETVETVTDYFLGGSKITADGDCSHEIKRHLLLGRKVMTNLESILKSRDITLPTKVHLVKTMVFPIVMCECELWEFIKKAEHWRIDAFELWCWRRLFRVPWTARRSNQSILNEISLEYPLAGLMLKLKLQYFGHLMPRTDSLEKTLTLGKIEGRRRRGRQRKRCLDGITDSVHMSLSKLRELVIGRVAWHAAVMGLPTVRHDWVTELTDWLNWLTDDSCIL